MRYTVEIVDEVGRAMHGIMNGRDDREVRRILEELNPEAISITVLEDGSVLGKNLVDSRT